MDSKNDRLNMFGNIKKSISWKKKMATLGIKFVHFEGCSNQIKLFPFNQRFLSSKRHSKVWMGPFLVSNDIASHQTDILDI